jgi:hypothetical protein
VVRKVNFTSSNNVIVSSTTFPHCNIKKNEMGETFSTHREMRIAYILVSRPEGKSLLGSVRHRTDIISFLQI